MDKIYIKSYRESLGLSIVDMAKTMQVSRSTYVKWERGERRVPDYIYTAVEFINIYMLSAVNLYRRRLAVKKSDGSGAALSAIAERYDCSLSSVVADVRFLENNILRVPTWGMIPSGKKGRTKIKDFDNHTCAYCGAKDVLLDVDHIDPKAKHLDNFCNRITSCRSCNRSKQNKTIDEWLRVK